MKSQPKTPVADLPTILAWMTEVRAHVRAEPWAKWCDFDGIDSLDILQTPIYLAVLSALRAGESSPLGWRQRMAAALRDRAHRLRRRLRERSAGGRPSDVAPADFLFWTRDPTHTNVMAPVARAVVGLGGSCRLMACQAGIFRRLEQVAPDAVYSLGAWPDRVADARRDGAIRAREIARGSRWNLPPFPGRNDAAAARSVRATVIEQLPLVAESIANARAAIEHFRPRVMVVGNDLTTEGRAACRVAAASGVRTAMFMHGAIDDNAIQASHLADQMLVVSERERQIFQSWGVDAARIVVCGAPQIDALPAQTRRVHPQLAAKFSLRADEPFVLVATSGPGHRISLQHHLAVIDQIDRLSRALPTTAFIVKLHLKDRLEHYRAALGRGGARRLFVQPSTTPDLPADIFTWLQGCQALLTGASTVATEAMLLGVPVVTMDFADEVRGVDFIDAGATRHVRSFDQLLAAVQELTRSPEPPADLAEHMQAYLGRAFHALDRRASERGARALFELARLPLPDKLVDEPAAAVSRMSE